MVGNRWIAIALLSALTLLAWAAPLVWAAEAAHGEAKDRQIFEWALDLGIWTIVVFLLLVFILKKYAWGPMLEGLQKREENIRAAIDEARAAREEAARLRETIQGERAKISEEARKVAEEARRRGEERVAELEAEARKAIQADRDRLHRELETAKVQVLKETLDYTSNLATLISAKAIQRQISEDDHRRLVDEALAELKQAGQAKYREVASVRA